MGFGFKVYGVWLWVYVAGLWAWGVVVRVSGLVEPNKHCTRLMDVS